MAGVFHVEHSGNFAKCLKNQKPALLVGRSHSPPENFWLTKIFGAGAPVVVRRRFVKYRLRVFLDFFGIRKSSLIKRRAILSAKAGFVKLFLRQFARKLFWAKV